MLTTESNKIRAIDRFVGLATRDLGTLDQIDETIAAISEIKAGMDLLAETIDREIVRIKDQPTAIDPDGSAIERLEKRRDELAQLHSAFEGKCLAARNAPELKDEDGVVEAYCELIDSTALLHNIVNELCWAIGEHDADFEQVKSGVFTSDDDLIAALGA